MPKQEKTKPIAVRIPREHFAAIQMVADLKGQDKSAALNEIIYEAMPRTHAWLVEKIGLRILAFRLVMSEADPKPSKLEQDLMEYMARMLPKRDLHSNMDEGKRERLMQALGANDGPPVRTSWEDIQLKASEFLLKVLNKEEDIYLRIPARSERTEPGQDS